MKFIPEIELNLIGIIFMIFCFMVLIQISYLFRFHTRLLFHKKRHKAAGLEPVTVIVCSRNEEDNLFKNLPKVLAQDYPEFEVIVVNDQSADDSRHIVRAYQEKHSNLKYIELERNKHRKFGKKVPLTVGIKGAKYNRLLMIDADCYPASDQWIKKIMSNYQEEKEIVVAYGPYEKAKGILNKIIRFDTVSIAATYLSFAKSKRPYMAVGRNFSYLKSTFFAVNGFKNHYHIQSGDDDLFMQDAANKKNVGIEMDPESFVYSHPKKTWKAWVTQKQRHFTTSSNYRLINKILLGIFPVSMILMLVSFIILMFSFEWWLFVVSVLTLRYLLYWWINGLIFKKLGENDLIALYPVFELVHFVIIPFIFYSTDRREPGKW
jgi:cellulose synthase/poly-beta-1,6-N-acetylglucosamine synthase-like glycosyltransferase